ncbi:SMP-30/gluconolactonase/LRE family protein [Tenacibaculum agarivorans]|uniref:SMP-30/gluconolactonase/LRE family protein n=1 Tax=Tenacibaculum agarivorans TaxID=1908389 RepID=UPI0013564008|nr:SMP-30/gluconolactonase/LRE family protein [Tenacibaculum agarivorans]
MYAIILLLHLSISSCKDEIVPRDPIVETLVMDFTGNDAVSVDQDGNVFVSEYGRFETTGGSGTKIFKVTPEGNVSEAVTNLTGPLGNAIDKDGNIYVNDANNTLNGKIVKINQKGEKSTIATIDGWPSGLTLDQENNIYVSNFSKPTVHKVSPNGQATLYASDSRLAGGVGIDFDTNGNLVVGNFSTADILSITPNGEVALIANIPNIVNQGFGIGYITVIEDNVYATGIAVNKIFKVSLKTGEITVLVGTGEAQTIDGDFSEAAFRTPNGITSDKRNKILYVSELGNSAAGALRKIYLPQ